MATLQTLTVNLVANTGEYQKGMSKASKITKSATKNIKTIGKVALGVGVAGIAALGTGMFLLAKKAIPAASNLVEAQNAVVKVFEESSDTILDWGKNAAKQAGLAESEFFQMSAQTGAMLQNLGIDQADAAKESVNLAQRAADMASIFNTDVADALGAIQAGLRGEADPLERFGVRLSAAAVKAKALELGLLDSTGAMTDQAKATASLALLYEQTDKMAGDFVETSGDFANAQRVAQAQVENIMATLGKMFLPVLGRVFGYISKTVLPIIDSFAKYISFVVDEGDYLNDFLADLPEWLQPIARTIGEIIKGFQDLFSNIGEGMSPVNAIADLLRNLFGPEVADQFIDIYVKVRDLINAFIEFKDKVIEFMAPIIDWIANNVTWKDVLIALGIAILTVIIPAVISLLATLLPIILIGAALILVVTLIRKAWEENWGGIRTTLLNIWNNTIKPKFELLKNWLAVFIPEAIETLKSFWEDTLKPALENFWNWVETTVFPLLQTLWDWLEVNVPAAIQTLTDFWNDTLLPALEGIWDFLSEDMMPIWVALVDLFDATVGVAIETLTALWVNVLWPALQDVWTFIQDKIIPMFTDLSESAGGVSGIIEKVAGFINDVADAIRNLPNYLPSWLRLGSPSEFELSLMGSASALSLLNDQMGLFDQRMDLRTPALQTGVAGADGAGTGTQGTMVVYGGLHLHGVEDGESLLEKLNEVMV